MVVEVVADEEVHGLAEDGGGLDAFELARDLEGFGDVVAGDVEAAGSGRVDLGELFKVVGHAADDEFGEVDVADVAAAFGFVHVMGGDEEGHAEAGELEEEVPEFAAGDGVDAGGGFVEEEDLGLVHEGAGHGEALAPAAGEEGGAAVEVGLEVGEGDEFFAAGFEFGAVEAVEASVELEVFEGGEFVVEGEFLGHIADEAFDLFGGLFDVEAGDFGGSFGGFEDAAEHADDGGFAGAVGAEEAKDGAFGDVEGDVVDGGEVAEAFGEVMAFDHGDECLAAGWRTGLYLGRLGK